MAVEDELCVKKGNCMSNCDNTNLLLERRKIKYINQFDVSGYWEIFGNSEWLLRFFFLMLQISNGVVLH